MWVTLAKISIVIKEELATAKGVAVLNLSNISLFQCSAYDSERPTLYYKLKNTCDENVLNTFLENLDFALCKLLQDHDDISWVFLKVINDALKKSEMAFNCTLPASKGYMYYFITIVQQL